jgi:glycerophosphoryl diester phosphodiesterase
MPSPTLVAHRGASREAPENTLAAFERALALGADGIELDVHATADGAVVVHHDPVPRPTSSEPGLAWRPFPALSLAEVRRLRVADTHVIPTLGEVLELVGDRLTVYCELKGAGVVEHAAPLLKAHRGPSAMHSFDHRAVRRAADLAPAIPRGVLLVSRLVHTLQAMSAAQATALWPQREYVDAELVREIHQAAGQVIVWTVNDPLEVRRVAALGVDSICTDDIAGARAALRSTFAQAGA